MSRKCLTLEVYYDDAQNTVRKIAEAIQELPNIEGVFQVHGCMGCALKPKGTIT
jgi:hypothetical protein